MSSGTKLNIYTLRHGLFLKLTRFIIVQFSRKILGQRSVSFSSDRILKHLGHLHVLKLVLFSDLDCLLLCLRARWSQQDYTLGFTGCFRAFKLQDAHNLL